jgi:hypothetical protein
VVANANFDSDAKIEAREKGWVAREGNSAEGRDQYATRLSDVAN